MNRNKYDDIYDYDIEDNARYEELNENLEDSIDELRGNIGRGDCLYCGSKHAMIYTGNICFICNKCSMSVHEDTYYRWAAGENIEFED